MSSIPGFASAQRAWENMEPSYAPECECPTALACAECGADRPDGTPCTEPDCDGAELEPVTLSVASCPEHGWCTGCYDRRCEDCCE